MTEQTDIVILGGGVIGMTTAWFLADAGVRVTLIEPHEFGQQASWAGAGIIPPGRLDHAATPVAQLRAHSAAMFPHMSRKLREQTGIDNCYTVCGALEASPGNQASVSDEWHTEGIAFEELHGQELHRRHPYLAAELQSAYFLPEIAQVRNPRHVKALRAVCEASGVRMLAKCPVHRLVSRDGRIEAVQTEQGRLTAGRYLIAAGAWTDALLSPFGVRLGIRPVRGQIALLNSEASRTWPVLLQGKRYMVPRGDGRILVGSTEEDAGFDARPTAAAIAELLDFAYQFVPDLKQAVVERCWAGLRPGNPDGKPFLGAVPGMDNLFVAAGHFRAGIQLSPATALVMKELLLGAKPTIPLDDFRLDRPMRKNPE